MKWRLSVPLALFTASLMAADPTRWKRSKKITFGKPPYPWANLYASLIRSWLVAGEWGSKKNPVRQMFFRPKLLVTGS